LLSAVYAREHDLVASTTSLVPYSRGCDDDLDLLRAARMPHGKAVLSFGMTSRRGVQRLHPNHYLDLMSWSPRRHWPTAPLDYHVYPEDAVEVVSRVIKRHIIAATRRGPLDLALTGGHDSRSILSCAREQLDRVELFTLEIPDNRAGWTSSPRHASPRHRLCITCSLYLPLSRAELTPGSGALFVDSAARLVGLLRVQLLTRSPYPEMTGVAGVAVALGTGVRARQTRAHAGRPRRLFASARPDSASAHA
jgi:hypothetical protein